MARQLPLVLDVQVAGGVCNAVSPRNKIRESSRMNKYGHA